MSTDEQVTPVAETQNQATAAVETPEVTTPENGATDEAREEPAKAEEPDSAEKSLKRMARRIDRVTAAKYQAEAEAQQLRQELARYQQQAQPEQMEQQADPYELAKTIAKVERITEKSNAVFAKGVQAFGGDAFREALGEVIAEAGPLVYPQGHKLANMPTALGEAILDSDAPEKLIHYLGKHPDVAEGLQGLTAAQLGRRIAKLEGEIGAKPAGQKPSSAPTPITPVKGSAKAEPDPSKMSDAEYAAWRRRQIAQRR